MKGERMSAKKRLIGWLEYRENNHPKPPADWREAFESRATESKGEARIRKAIKPYIVRRENGGCQVLFPLSKLDEILEEKHG